MTARTQRNLDELIEIDAGGWIPALPIPKRDAVPQFVEELRDQGYEVKDEIEETAGGYVVRYRPNKNKTQKEDKPMSNQMQADAIAKLRAEMNGHENHFVAGLGEFLINHIENNPQDAEKFLQKGKTFDGLWDYMIAAARKLKPYKNVAMFMPNEECAMILKYYGIEGATVTLTTPAHAPQVADSDLDIDLNDFF